MKLPRLAPPSDHMLELVVLAGIVGGVVYLGSDGDLDAAAISAVLMAIISAIKERWTQRSVDRMGQNLANSPPADPPAPPGGENEK